MPSFLHLEGARHVRVCLTFVLLRFEQRQAKKLLALLDAVIFIKNHLGRSLCVIQ